MVAGSISFSTELDNKELEKQLHALTKKIEKKERDIAEIASRRDQAKEKSLFDAAALDEEKAKLEEIKDRLAEIRARAKDKTLSLEDRETAKGLIPSIKQEYEDQRTRVRGLQDEWNKTETAVERYNAQLSAAEQELDRQKEEAGHITQELDEARKAAGGMGGMLDRAGKRMEKLGDRLKGLASRAFVFTLITSALRGMRSWLGKTIKTNDEARQSIAQLKGALLTLAQPLVQVIIPAFTTLMNILTRIITAAASLVSTLFGKTLKQSQEGAKALYKEASAIDAVGDAAKKAAGSLAGFDEINTIQTENSSAGGGGSGASDEITPGFSWMDGMDGILDKLEKVSDLVGLIGAGLALWKISGMLPGVLGDISGKLAGIALAIGGLLLLWNGLTDAWENGVGWLNLIEMIGGLAAAAGGLYLLLGPVAAGIALIVGALALLVTGFHDAMESGWNLQNTLLSIAGILAAGLGISVIAGSWIPLLVAGIASVLLALTVATGHGGELIEGVRTILEGFSDFFTGIFSGDIEKAVGGIVKIFDGLKMSVFAVLDGAKDSLLSFLVWLDEKTGGKFHSIIETAKGFVSAFAESAEEILSGMIDAAKQIFEGIIQFITGVFTGDWEEAWEGVKNIFKGIWNGIVSLLEGAVNLIIQGLNWLISQMNKISFSVPDWVPGIGGKKLGVNIPSLPEAKIPRLARGAVIPPNREFLAVLGDQRSGTNIEAPLATIKQALAEVMSEHGGSGGDIHITVEMDGVVITRKIVKRINDMTRQAGKPVLLY